MYRALDAHMSQFCNCPDLCRAHCETLNVSFVRHQQVYCGLSGATKHNTFLKLMISEHFNTITPYM